MSKQISKTGRIAIFLLIILAVIVFVQRDKIFSKSIQKTYRTESQVSSTKPPLIQYEILRRWVIGKSGTGLEILVSEKASKYDVLELANDIFEKNQKIGFTNLMIFDSKEAWENRNNDNYPQGKYFLHFLVSTISGKVQWTAEGRDH